MAHTYYEVSAGILSMPSGGVEGGRILRSDELDGIGGGKRADELIRSGALKKVEAREGELKYKAQLAADAASEGGIEDQSFQETVADELARPHREELAEAAHDAPVAEGQLESPRVAEATRVTDVPKGRGR